MAKTNYPFPTTPQPGTKGLELPNAPQIPVVNPAPPSITK